MSLVICGRLTTALPQYPAAPPREHVPSGCRWCGVAQRDHMQRWKSEPGWHAWEQPTDSQVLARMRARQAVRLLARPTQYHAHTGENTFWSYASDAPVEEEYCADCFELDCAQWVRTQERLDEQRRSWRPAYAYAYPDEEPF